MLERIGLCGFLVGALWLGGLHTTAQAQTPIPAMANRDVAFVAATPGYRLHSDFWLNLHQYLYGIAGGGPEEGAGFTAEASDCFASLDESLAAPWRAASAYYADHVADRENRRDPLMASVRYALNDLGTEYDDDPEFARLVAHLRGAAPAYRSCLWERHDARNRAAIGELVSTLVRHARPLQVQLSNYYRAAWPRSVAVDVVSYVSFAKANTTGGPGRADHILIASGQSGIDGFDGLETLLHEASHIMFGARHGAVTDALGAAADSLGARVPRGLWHAISFHTSGTVVQRAAKGAGEEYEPYWLRNDLFTSYQQAIREHWVAYLDGEADLEEVAARLVRELAIEP